MGRHRSQFIRHAQVHAWYIHIYVGTRINVSLSPLSPRIGAAKEYMTAYAHADKGLDEYIPRVSDPRVGS
jgi:hypothetical protein